ncbi:hypothetical protein TCAL_10817 [Tigriopus californicus]|uniref:Trehalase n=1 Tax=Tigriopus californicus TaxID=6832 RepID=A0A553NFS1_TIGCA|nr:trehalase-like [Tigriopus californicus]TRY64287.1 hypothetical protein TCAL_10817 [Tigriopus californicus]|eukprot:TCALIF_10817-PA protein Name:"Similar to Trehalase (Tenebrio molitor)" AED:0.07 eAED:0.07 QI:0/-1/0/1/-1/1/1/0/597
MSSLILDNVPDVPPTDSKIWGYGPLLETLQLSKLFKDSKTFVDLKLIRSEEDILVDFQHLSFPPKQDDLLAFLERNFDLTPGLEFEEWNPPDWVPKPAYLDQLHEKPLIYVGMQVNKLWNTLSRRCSAELKKTPELFSKIDLPHGFIMPGGRFREIYYWDTYWIIRGLLISDMDVTVRGILENFIHQIKLFGHIPNGTRKYYERRSQPPYLISMVSKYLEKTNDKTFLSQNLEHLEKELKFFETHRTILYKWKGQNYRLFHYGADCRGPRPESYVEDLEIGTMLFKTLNEREEFYLQMKAAAESGWDFSSRWFIDPNGNNMGTLADAKTTYIAPVDLNALMFKNYNQMACFYDLIGDTKRANEHVLKAREMMKAMCYVFWDAVDHIWYDIDMLNHKHRKFFYASNLFPLWAEAYPKRVAIEIGECAVDYLLNTGVTEHKGGIPASTQHTRQQWDWNAWPPIQHFIVAGLNKTKNLRAQQLAFKIAKNYVSGTIASCNVIGGICGFFEKYDPLRPGVAGGGGEYEVQKGFGWTNGVLVDFIAIYGDDLLQRDTYTPKESGKVYGITKKLGYKANTDLFSCDTASDEVLNLQFKSTTFE